MPLPLVIAAIGNPGPGYASTRHNAGVMLVEELARRLQVKLKRSRGRVRLAEAHLEGRQILLGVPISYMNESGPGVLHLVRKAGIRPPDLVVCHDELDIPLGRVRLKVGGGTAGHRGIESVCNSLRSRDFLRLRIGIGRPEPGDDAVEKVLTSFRPDERATLEAAIVRGIDGLHILVREGVDAAQRFLHAPGPAAGPAGAGDGAALD